MNLFKLSYYLSLHSEFRVVMSITISTYNRCSIRLSRSARVLFQVFVFLCIMVSNAYCVVCFCSFCLRIVYPMLPVSLDYPFLIAPSVSSYVYLIKIVPLLLQRSENCNMPIVLSVLLRFTAFDYTFGIFKPLFETTSNLTLHYIDN